MNIGDVVMLEPLFVEFIPDELEDKTLYISLEYNTAVHLCACGCKNKTVTPFNEGGWHLIITEDKVSLIGSIGNYYFPCKSHYTITNNVATFQ